MRDRSSTLCFPRLWPSVQMLVMGSRPGLLIIIMFAIVPLLPSPGRAAEPADQNEASQATADAEAVQFFENEVRPILAQHCQKCHGPDKQSGGLRLDSADAVMRGGDSEMAIVPGKPEESLLIEAVNYESLEMPPEGKLSDGAIATLTRWVKMGAPWPGGAPSGAPVRPGGEQITDEDRQFWSFRPVVRPDVPQASDSAWIQSPIDAFILAELEKHQLSPSPPATRRELIRRAYFDLIGLPPTAEEIAAFEADASSDAFEKVIDRLLAMPQYGERWGRHWLDVVRYAQTNGYERDGEKPFSWRYRDYVIESLNADKPYDRFIVEQLAGDELDTVTDESLAATAFYRLGVWDDEPDDARQAEFDALDDMLSTTGTAILGLTIGCARCHDHKFDPISQEDYYSTLAFLRNVAAYSNNGDNILVELPSGAGKTLAVREAGPKAPETHVLIRGDAGSPGKMVEPRFPQVLCRSDEEMRPALPEHSPEQAASRATSGRRRVFAQWVARRENPLTSRVIANRLWHHHFGRGIVPTPSDFGHTGLSPSHPEMLDWLASELVDGGWRLKRMHKLIMLSNAYQQSSRIANAAALTSDPDNALVWRQNLRRLDAEVLRDAILAVNGGLNLSLGGPSFFPRLPSEVLASQSRPGLGWGLSDETQSARRSIYIFVKRTLQTPLLEQFDVASPDKPTAARSRTTVAPQALTLLNSDFIRTQATKLADRLIKEAGDDPRAQIERGYALALGRRPSDGELQASVDFLNRRRAAIEAAPRRLTFFPQVPGALSTEYLNKLQSHQFLAGPENGWTYHRGSWDDRGDGIHWVDVERGPFALWQGMTLQDGVVEAKVTLPNNSELAAVIFRGQNRAHSLVGYELLLDPRHQTARLVRVEDNVTTLGTASTGIPAGDEMAIKIEIAGGRIRAWLGDSSQPLLEAIDPRPLPPGQLGVGAGGGGLELERWTIQSGGQTVHVGDPVVEPVSSAPLPEWKYFGGTWTSPLDGSYRGVSQGWQYAVWDTPRLADGVLECDLLPDESHHAQLIFRVNDPRPGVDTFIGYEVSLHAGHDFVRLGRHENDFQHIVDVPRKLEAGQWVHVKVVLSGGRIQVFLDQETEPVIDRTDDRPLPAGSVALRTDGVAGFRNLQVSSGEQSWLARFRPDEPTTLDDDPQGAAARRALAAWCLLLLNLNEFVYID